MNEIPTPPDDPKGFFKLMPKWLIERAAADGIDLRSVGLLQMIWLRLVNREMASISDEVKKVK